MHGIHGESVGVKHVLVSFLFLGSQPLDVLPKLVLLVGQKIAMEICVARLP